MTRRAEQEFQREFGTHTPVSYRERLRAWYLEGYDSEFGVDYAHQPERTAEEITQRRIGDAERIACTLLDQAGIEHPALTEWLRNLTQSTTYVEDLDRTTMDAVLNGDNVEDREAYLLGVAVRRQRLYGEPDTDYTEPVARGLQYVTSSLAAAVVEYVQALENHRAHMARRRRS